MLRCTAASMFALVLLGCFDEPPSDDPTTSGVASSASSATSSAEASGNDDGLSSGDGLSTSSAEAGDSETGAAGFTFVEGCSAELDAMAIAACNGWCACEATCFDSADELVYADPQYVWDTPEQVPASCRCWSSASSRAACEALDAALAPEPAPSEQAELCVQDLLSGPCSMATSELCNFAEPMSACSSSCADFLGACWDAFDLSVEGNCHQPACFGE